MGAAALAVVCYPSALTLLALRDIVFAAALAHCFKSAQFCWHLPCSLSPDAWHVSRNDLTVLPNTRAGLVRTEHR